RLLRVEVTLHETEVVPLGVAYIREIAHPWDWARLVHLAAPGGEGRRKGGLHIRHVHRAGVAKLRDGPLGRILALAEPPINAALPLTGRDEPVVHPLDFLDRPAEDLLVEGDGSLDIIRIDIEMHYSIGHGLPPPVASWTNKRSRRTENIAPALQLLP